MDGVAPNSGITAMIAKRDRCPQGKKCANSPSRACRRRSDGLEPASSTEILRRYIASPRFNVAGECGFVGNAIVDSRDGGHFLRLYLNTGCMLRARSPKIVLQQYRHFSGETISLHLSPLIWGEADLLRTCASVMPHAASGS